MRCCSITPKSVLYRVFLQRGLFVRSWLAPTTFYRMVRTHQLFETESGQKHRLSFAMTRLAADVDNFERWRHDTGIDIGA